ncbi:MAG: tetratricopeptide repeat protein [Planctomycetales bacterium]|nr:tetratricopeptide repeat protein [Planctomycetales bacterium]
MPLKSRLSAAPRKLAKPALSLVAVVVCLAIGEVVVRSFGSAPELKAIQLESSDCVYKRSTNPVLGFELKSNYASNNPDFIDSYERTNSHGQRDKPRSLEKPEGVTRVLLLGDSVVEGYGLPEDQTISQQLEQQLGPATEVLNFGVSAYCTLAEIELLEVKGLAFDPDVVVLLFVENDFDNFNREAFALGGTIDRPALVNSLFARSHLFRLACVQWNWFHFGMELDPVALNQQAIGNNNVVKGVQRFGKLARDHGFKPLIVVWPRFLNEEIVNVGFMDETRSLLIIEHLAGMNQIPVARLSEFFRQHHEESGDSLNFRLAYTNGDALHPSRLGSQVAAGALRTLLNDLESGTLAAQPKPPQLKLMDEKAISLAQSLSKDQPSYSRVHDRLGTELLKQEKISEAIVEFKKAIDADSNNAAAFNNLGVAYERQHLDELAMEQFKQAIMLQPDFVHANFNLARAFHRAGNKKVALAGLRKTIDLDPDHVQALSLLGRELGMNRDFAEAEKHLKHALSIDPNHSEGHNNLGVIYAAAGNLQQAVFHFREAIRVDPTNDKAKMNLESIQKRIDKLGIGHPLIHSFISYESTELSVV